MQNALKRKDFFKSNINKIIISCFVFVFCLGLFGIVDSANNKNVSAATTYYFYVESEADSWGPSLTVDSSGLVTLGGGSDIGGALNLSYGFGADSSFLIPELISVDGDWTTKTFQLSSYDLQEFTAYRLYFWGSTYNDDPANSKTYIVSITPMIELPPDPVKEGHTFIGWFYDEAFTQPYVVGTPLFEGTSLYAKFDINQYTVNYYHNSSLYQTKTINYNALAENLVITTTGYIFSGWHTDSACAVDYNFSNPVMSNLSLYSKSAINTYTVTFNSNGGTITGGNATQTINYGSPAIAPTVSRTGYTFSGWDKAFNNITGNLTVTAQWTINTYTVTFNSNDGTITSGNATQTINYGSPAIAPTVSRTGYTFSGWDKQFNNITGNLTVIAQWEIITFEVTFYVDGVVYDTITVDYGTMFYENASVQGIMKTLSAVYSDTEKTALFAPLVAVNEDITLYADVNASLRNWLDFALWFQKYWIWLAVGLGVLVTAVVIVVIKLKRGVNNA